MTQFGRYISFWKTKEFAITYSHGSSEMIVRNLKTNKWHSLNCGFEFACQLYP